MAIKALAIGYSHERAAALFDVNEGAVSRRAAVRLRADYRRSLEAEILTLVRPSDMGQDVCGLVSLNFLKGRLRKEKPAWIAFSLHRNPEPAVGSSRGRRIFNWR